MSNEKLKEVLTYLQKRNQVRLEEIDNAIHFIEQAHLIPPFTYEWWLEVEKKARQKAGGLPGRYYYHVARYCWERAQDVLEYKLTL